jgi:hypothetical protein
MAPEGRNQLVVYGVYQLSICERFGGMKPWLCMLQENSAGLGEVGYADCCSTRDESSAAGRFARAGFWP